MMIMMMMVMVMMVLIVRLGRRQSTVMVIVMVMMMAAFRRFGRGRWRRFAASTAAIDYHMFIIRRQATLATASFHAHIATRMVAIIV